MSDTAQLDANLVDIEIDGIPMKAEKGSMIIEAADKAGIDIPRFCYHKKLSIAANCRMCLVDVEKAPKPLPACATPVMNGMKVFTESRRAVDAQHGVMEFLLINHPLDCPICDQGGECELQDLAMGYGRSVSRFSERKRVVKDKNVGPLIQTDMTRCIHCTRCVRFTEEIAGTSELGGFSRGDSTEIGTFIENNIESELSGNVIDVCPVGALTNKPFRYSARAWELRAEPSVAAHDGVGSNLFYHQRRGRILRAVPRDNESLNESWLSDRDRYSHYGLYHDDRVLEPMVKRDGEWRSASWDDAIDVIHSHISNIMEFNGPAEIGCVMSPSAFNEEYYLAQKLMRALGSQHIDHRLRQVDFSDDGQQSNAPLFECSISELGNAGAILLLGSNIRHEAPLLGHKVRQAALSGAAVMTLNPVAYNLHFPVHNQQVVAPQAMLAALARVASALQVSADEFAELMAANPADDDAQAVAEALKSADNAVILVGEAAMNHGQAGALRQLARVIAAACGAQANFLGSGANAQGARVWGALPGAADGESSADAGKNLTAMLNEPLQAYLLWDLEPEFDIQNPGRAVKALSSASKVIAVSSFASGALKEVADVILPLAPHAESEGTLTSLDGLAQAVKARGKAQGEARAGWKIIRRLGERLGLDGFDYLDIDELRADMGEGVSVAQQAAENPAAEDQSSGELHRIGDTPLYSIDALCRRSNPLQETEQAKNYFAALHPEEAKARGLDDEQVVRCTQEGESTELPVKLDNAIPKGAVFIASGTCSTRMLGDSYGPVTLEVV